MISALTGLFRGTQRTEVVIVERTTPVVVMPLPVLDDIPLSFFRQRYCLEHLRRHGRNDMIGTVDPSRPYLVPMKHCEELDILLAAINANWDRGKDTRA